MLAQAQEEKSELQRQKEEMEEEAMKAEVRSAHHSRLAPHSTTHAGACQATEDREKDP